MKRLLALLCVCVVLAAGPILAQAGVVTAALSPEGELAKLGVLGLVAAGALAWAGILYRRTIEQQAMIHTLHTDHASKLLAIAVESSRWLAENNVISRRQIDLLDKLLERARAP